MREVRYWRQACIGMATDIDGVSKTSGCYIGCVHHRREYKNLAQRKAAGYCLALYFASYCVLRAEETPLKIRVESSARDAMTAGLSLHLPQPARAAVLR